MEKNVKRNSGFTIVFIFVIILLSVTIVMNYIVYKEKEKLNSESGTQEKNYNDKVKELETLNAEVQQEEEKIKDLENLDNAILLMKQNSRHYAKRQYTWFLHQMNVKWFTTNYDNFNQTIDDVVNYIAEVI